MTHSTEKKKTVTSNDRALVMIEGKCLYHKGSFTCRVAMFLVPHALYSLVG
jgi:hypothetical protein